MDAELNGQMKNILDSIVNKNIKNNVFTACSVGVIERNKDSFDTFTYHYGKSGMSGKEKLVDNATVYDLASLTKPLVTSLSLLALVEEGKLNLSEPVSSFFDFSGNIGKRIKVIHLLEHTSGLPAHREYYKRYLHLTEDERSLAIVSSIGKEDLIFEPGSGELYSDLGYILLGKIVEKITGKNLDLYWTQTILGPLKLNNGLFFTHNEPMKEKVFGVTGRCQWSNKELSGVVNDDNCRIIGGVAGHAGLFGTADALVQLSTTLIQMYNGSYAHPAISFELMREALQEKRGRWVLGFDTPSRPTSSSGRYFSNTTIGHLGFTGTSFWLDCKEVRGVVLLTNRVLCGEDLTGIQKFRPTVHDTIQKILTDRKNTNPVC